jgi:hypothetical protein
MTLVVVRVPPDWTRTLPLSPANVPISSDCVVSVTLALFCTVSWPWPLSPNPTTMYDPLVSLVFDPSTIIAVPAGPATVTPALLSVDGTLTLAPLLIVKTGAPEPRPELKGRLLPLNVSAPLDAVTTGTLVPELARIMLLAVVVRLPAPVKAPLNVRLPAPLPPTVSEFVMLMTLEMVTFVPEFWLIDGNVDDEFKWKSSAPPWICVKFVLLASNVIELRTNGLAMLLLAVVHMPL